MSLLINESYANPTTPLWAPPGGGGGGGSNFPTGITIGDPPNPDVGGATIVPFDIDAVNLTGGMFFAFPETPTAGIFINPGNMSLYRTVGSPNTIALFDPSSATVALSNVSSINGNPVGGGGTLVQTFYEAQPSGTAGGAPTTVGSYFARTLNSGSPALSGSNSTTISGMSITSNTITVPAGTYAVTGSTPAWAVGRHKARVYDTTNSNVIILGQSAYADAGGGQVQVDSALVEGVFTVTSNTTIELQQQVENSAGAATLSLGVPCSFGDNEIYSTITFQKIA